MIAAALTTPFGPDEEVDLGGVRALVEHVIGAGVPAVFVAGTNGEFPALDDGERLDVISTALETAGPSRVIAHVGAATTRQAVRLTAEARRRGAERLAVITPYFVPAGPQRLVEHFERCAAAADGAAVHVYVFTALAGTVVPPALLSELAEIEGVVGVKVSGAGADAVRAYAEAVPAGFDIWSGNDGELPEVLAAGGSGIVSGNAGALPSLFARVLAGYDAQPSVRSAVDTVHGSIANLKYLLDLQGLPGGRCRMAIDPPGTRHRAALADLLKRADLLDGTDLLNR
ncbi:dihydrodipicolinate synthase family protein [Kribbella turkmenica]|uniref:Dihydrodipicolinate synthase family protein n=1 Tax=Kribbella turkmenica TaxID=2530375 RepID=A0A4V2YE20_9ACTN|nr:dihydrodipicolinate synthase family protein [Kribbella turkmenica]TDD17666.1 dihydrodipicolinate synthase family protein [Kribbella turkmenica]